MPDDFKYNPNSTAVPVEIIQRNFDKIKQGKLHPKRPGQSVRREMTERRISNNIMLYNSAVMKPDAAELFVGQKMSENPNNSVDMLSTAGPTSVGISDSRAQPRFKNRNNSLQNPSILKLT